MAHLYADREEDGFWGLGYATAEDRMEEVLFLYLMMRSELAAKFGPGAIDPKQFRFGLKRAIDDTIESDRFVLRDRYLEDARKNLLALSPQLQRNLAGYVAGFQSYMREYPDRVPAWVPQLEAALPLALYAWMLQYNIDAICDGRLPRPSNVRSSARSSGEHIAGFASNAFVLAKTKTTDGAVMFSSDSHFVVELFGTFFYQWRMKAGAFDFLGLEPTGTATMLFGHSPNFAWGWTEGPRYTGDCYEVETKQGDPLSYEYDGQDRRLIVVEKEIQVKGRAAARARFEYTDHNGVLSPVIERRGRSIYVASSSYMGRVGFAHEQYYRMANARSRAELGKALEMREIYPSNLLLGGLDGTILFIRPARIPVRPPGVDATRLLNGNTSATAWRGLHALAELVQIENPQEGYLANDNISPDMMFPTLRVDPQKYPAYFAFAPGQTNTRQRRHIELLSRDAPFSVQQAIDIVYDEMVLGTDRWGPAIERVLSACTAKSCPAAAAFKDFTDQLVHFNGVFSHDSRGALYHLTMREELLRSSPEQSRTIGVAIAATRELTATQRAALRSSIVDAYRRLEKEHGAIAISFGDVHRIQRGRQDAPGGGITFRTVPGVMYPDTAALRASEYAPAGRVRHYVSGPRNPFLVSFSQPVRSYSLNLFGISDDPASPHYADQVPLASERRLHTNSFDSSELASTVRSSKILATGLP